MRSFRCRALSEAGVSSLGVGSWQVYLYARLGSRGPGCGPGPLDCWPPILSLTGWAVEGGESEARGQNLGVGLGAQ